MALEMTIHGSWLASLGALSSEIVVMRSHPSFSGAAVLPFRRRRPHDLLDFHQFENGFAGVAI
jgi:hypothetical protein